MLHNEFDQRIRDRLQDYSSTVPVGMWQRVRAGLNGYKALKLWRRVMVSAGTGTTVVVMVVAAKYFVGKPGRGHARAVQAAAAGTVAGDTTEGGATVVFGDSGVGVVGPGVDSGMAGGMDSGAGRGMGVAVLGEGGMAADLEKRSDAGKNGAVREMATGRGNEEKMMAGRRNNNMVSNVEEGVESEGSGGVVKNGKRGGGNLRRMGDLDREANVRRSGNERDLSRAANTGKTGSGRGANAGKKGHWRDLTRGGNAGKTGSVGKGKDMGGKRNGRELDREADAGGMGNVRGSGNVGPTGGVNLRPRGLVELPVMARVSTKGVVTMPQSKKASASTIQLPKVSTWTKLDLHYEVAVFGSPDFPLGQFGWASTEGARATVHFFGHYSLTIGFQHSTVIVHRDSIQSLAFPDHFLNNDVPILIGYTFGTERFQLMLNAGPVFNVHSFATLETPSPGVYSPDRTGTSAYIGLRMTAKFGKHLGVFAEPYIKNLFGNNITEIPNPYQTTGILFGLSYHF